MVHGAFDGVEKSNKTKTITGRHGGSKKYTIEDIERSFLDQKPKLDNRALKDSQLKRGLLDTATITMGANIHPELRTISDMVPENREHDAESADQDDLMEMDNVGYTDQTTSTAFVVDTNFILSHLHILEDLRCRSRDYQHQIVIPRTVIHELDGLKNATDKFEKKLSGSSEPETISLLARKANDWIYTHLANLNSAVIGQRLNQKTEYRSKKDDAILDCCLYYREKLHLFTVLMSNDKNLCLKALTEKILTVSFREGMSANIIAQRVYEERNFVLNNAKTSGGFGISPEPSLIPEALEHPNINFGRIAQQVYQEIEAIVPSAIDYIMHTEYGDELDLTDYRRAKISNLRACCRCVEKFWVSVFSAYFRESEINKQSWSNPESCLVSVPAQKTELEDLVNFWVFALQCFYKNRDDTQKKALTVLSERWTKAYVTGDI